MSSARVTSPHQREMDNELTAPFDAKVKTIHFKTGENVVKDAVLIELG